MDSRELGNPFTENSKEACGQIRVIVIDEQKIIPGLDRKVIRLLLLLRGKRAVCAPAVCLCGWWLNGGEFLANAACPP